MLLKTNQNSDGIGNQKGFNIQNQQVNILGPWNFCFHKVSWRLSGYIFQDSQAFQTECFLARVNFNMWKKFPDFRIILIDFGSMCRSTSCADAACIAWTKHHTRYFFLFLLTPCLIHARLSRAYRHSHCYPLYSVPQNFWPIRILKNNEEFWRIMKNSGESPKN